MNLIIGAIHLALPSFVMKETVRLRRRGGTPSPYLLETISEMVGQGPLALPYKYCISN
jgi:hypothetical protein